MVYQPRCQRHSAVYLEAFSFERSNQDFVNTTVVTTWSNSVTIEQRFVVKFYIKLGKTILKFIIYWKNCLGLNVCHVLVHVFEWFKRFQDGREDDLVAFTRHKWMKITVLTFSCIFAELLHLKKMTKIELGKFWMCQKCVQNWWLEMSHLKSRKISKIPVLIRSLPLKMTQIYWKR